MHRILATCVLATLPFAAVAQDATGTWRTEATNEGALEIQIAPCGANLCGTIARAIGPDGQSGPYPHLGRQMVWDMAPNGAGQWSGGKIWDPRNDRTFNSKMELRGAALVVSGCFLGICQGMTWQRVN